MENRREKKSLKELVQMAPHFLTRGPERQQRRNKEIKIVWMPGLGKPCRTEPAHAESQKGWKSETPGSLRQGLAAACPCSPPICAARAPPCPPLEDDRCILVEMRQRLPGAAMRLLTEGVGSSRKSTHGVTRFQTPHAMYSQYTHQGECVGSPPGGTPIHKTHPKHSLMHMFLTV